MDLVQGRFPIAKVVEDGDVLDIRVVWNSKSNGYNEQIWVPGFMLPTWSDAKNMVCKWLVMTVGRYLELGSPVQDYTAQAGNFRKSDQGDIDTGEMFQNFIIHETERHALGVRCIKTRHGKGELEETEFRRFCRLHFGGKGSPYAAFQGQTILLDLCVGNREDEKNPFHWKEFHCNLPTAVEYDASMPRIMKLRSDGELACDKITFVDDTHVAGRRAAENAAGESLASRSRG